MKTTGKRRLYRQLVAASLIMGGAFQLAAPVLAAGTAAGTSISNTATGSYEDGSGTPINTTSNTVNITVAEVAGIDVSGSNTPVSAAPGGTINYDFTIKNTGNDATKFVLPKTATLTGAGATGANYVVIYDANGDGTFAATEEITTATTTTAPINPSVSASTGIAKVRVVVTVGTSAPVGEKIIVQYGDSLDNTNNGTNQENQGNVDNTKDVKTEDPTTGTGDDPVNGVREDSATLEGTVSGTAVILNGTKDHADATGPAITGQTNTNNTDFTNKNTAVDAGIAPGTTTLPDGTPYNPAAVTFDNTISNTGTVSGDFKVQPTTAAGILDATNGHLPNATKVTITNAADTSKTATYTWDNTNKKFDLDSGSTPVVITVAQNGTAHYTVKVDLPPGTTLSTDLTTVGDINTAYGGFAVPIAAYIDADNDKIVDTGETQNLTTDRVYTGFLRLLKESRVTKGSGPDVTVTDNTFSLDPKKPAPGNIVEYRITYKNISENPSSGANNVTLTATSVVITENGTLNTKSYPTLPDGNNWGQDYDGNGTMDTSHVSATAEANTTIKYYEGTTGATLITGTPGVGVTKYINDGITVAPQGSGIFTIGRKIN